ncbi:MAG: hypothetical protein ACI8S6_005995 [Myxococcota bacterium]|jgi:hypothetical protein
MGPLIVIPLLLLLLAAGVVIVAGGVYTIRRLSQPIVPAALPPAPDTEGEVEDAVEVVREGEDWSEGDDLLRYPRRLSELESKLTASFNEVERQSEHLDDRLSGLHGKEGREGITVRYKQDMVLLGQRGRSMRRVLGLVWRTRAILELRAHLAISARQRPLLDDLPGVDVNIRDIDGAVDAYEDAARRVRRFVTIIEDRGNEVPLAVPGAPIDAELTPELQEEVDSELRRIEETYTTLRERMDHLADTLVYLADRCGTRRVVEGSPAGIDARDGSGEALIDEVNLALSDLTELAAVGEVHMADSTLDALAEDISQLERAGLEAQAEADAAMEVARLLEHFPAR